MNTENGNTSKELTKTNGKAVVHPNALKDMSGLRCGRLTVLKQGPTQNKHVRWVCVCDCGTERIVRAESLRDGTTKSCGCLQREAAAKSGRASRKHGMKDSPEYKAWIGMKNRCENTDYVKFHLWGGRGIRICESWRGSFSLFSIDMGPKPSPAHSLDRYPDNDGNYEPGNCRWATAKQQDNNRRKRTMLCQAK